MAVYTQVPDDEMDAFIASYGLGELISCKGIAEGVENTNYLVQTQKGPFILTLYEKRVNAAELPFFLHLMEHLQRAGVSCPTPVHDSNGNILRELAGRPAALITFLDGLSVRRPKRGHCKAVGSALAKLHLAGRDYGKQRPNALGISGWRPLYDKFSARTDEIRPGLAEIIDTELAELEARWPATIGADRHASWPGGIATGVIHADLFPDNVFFRGDTLSGIIDFYFGCTDAFVYDIAICLNAWCFDPDHAFNYTKGQALLRGYQAVRPLSAAEIDIVPLLARGAALRFLLTRAYDWLNTPPDALVSPKDPAEYLRYLRFHQSVTSARDYGLES